MPTHDTTPFTEPRRKDRAIRDEASIRDLLERAPIGIFATQGRDAPSLNPNLFVFDPVENAIYLHTAHKGQTRSNVKESSMVAFSVAEMGRLLPADAAVNFSVEYASVVLTGPSKVVEDADEATRCLELFMAKYAPQFELGRDYEGIRPKDLARTSVFRIDIENWSAKGKTSDAPDAYNYEAVAPTSCPWGSPSQTSTDPSAEAEP